MSTKHLHNSWFNLGGGFAEYVKVRVILSATGAISIPTEVSFEQASFGGTTNCCLKAVKAQIALVNQLW